MDAALDSCVSVLFSVRLVRHLRWQRIFRVSVCVLHTAILFGPVPHGLVPLFSPIYYSGVHTTPATRLFLDVTRHMSRTHASTRV